MDEKMIAVDGRRLQVSGTGSGPVTLLILSGSNILFPSLEYASLANALSPWYSVLIPSKFGYGHSDLTEAPRDVDTVVEEYRRALAACGRPVPVVLAAHSMGFLGPFTGRPSIRRRSPPWWGWTLLCQRSISTWIWMPSWAGWMLSIAQTGNAPSSSDCSLPPF